MFCLETTLYAIMGYQDKYVLFINGKIYNRNATRFISTATKMMCSIS